MTNEEGLKSYGAIPDSAEYWWPAYEKVSNKDLFPKKKIPPHDCKPRGGIKGTPLRRFCKICGKAFSKNYFKERTPHDQ